MSIHLHSTQLSSSLTGKPHKEAHKHATNFTMKLQLALPLLLPLLGMVEAGTQVNWYGCSGEYGVTVYEGGILHLATNVDGWRRTNLCGVWVPPPGSDHCNFYTVSAGDFSGTTYTCTVASGRCNAQPWEAIRSYECWAE